MKKKILTIVLAVGVCVVGVLLGIEYTTAKNAGIPKDNVTQVQAPDQTESMEHPDFVKEEFVAEVPDGTNIAPNASKVDANACTGNYVARNTIDGDTDGASYWEGEGNNYPNTLTFTYDEPVSIHAMRLLLNPDPIWGKRTQEFEIQVSTDGENYETLVEKQGYEFDPDTGNQVIAEFEATDIKGIQLIFYSNTGANAGQAAEVELYSN